MRVSHIRLREEAQIKDCYLSFTSCFDGMGNLRGVMIEYCLNVCVDGCAECPKE